MVTKYIVLFEPVINTKTHCYFFIAKVLQIRLLTLYQHYIGDIDPSMSNKDSKFCIAISI